MNDLLLGNDVSAARAHSLFVDAEAAGVANVGDMARCGRRGKYPGNLHREMLGKLVKRSQWPKPNYGEVLVFDRKTGECCCEDSDYVATRIGAHIVFTC